MINFEQLYTRYGVTRISRIKAPIILDLKSLELPYNSTLHLFTIDNAESYVTSDEVLLSKNKEIVVRTVDEYKGITQGNFRYKRPEVRSFIKTNMDLERKFRVLKETEQKIVLTRNDILVYNYGGLTNFYTYVSNPLVPYFKVINSLTTLIELVNKDSQLDRNFFVNFTVTIPKYNILEMLLTKKINSALLKKMSSYNYIIYIELWKFFNPETRNESVFNNLTLEASKKFNIIFTIGNNGAIVNFFKLASIVKEYKEFDYDIGTVDSKQFRKVLYLYLNKIFSSLVNIESNLIENDEDDRISEEELDVELEASELVDDYEEDDIDFNLGPISRTDVDDIAIDIEFDNIEDIKNDTPKTEPILVNKISTLKDLGVISKTRASSLANSLVEQDEIEFTVNNKTFKLGDMKKDLDFNIPKEETSITPSIVATEPGMLGNTLNALDKKVITEQLTPYIVKSMLSVQNSSFVVKDFKVSSNESILGEEDVYEMVIESLDGGRSKLKLILPKVNEDGTFKISSNTYIMRRQKADLPIRKISDTRVSLSSNYGKLFIDKASLKRLEISYWLKNELVKLYNNDIITNLVLNNSNKLPDSVELPQHYTYFSKYVKGFKYHDFLFNFNYNTRDSVTDIKLNELEEYGTLIGTRNNNPIIMTMDNRLLEYNKGKVKEIGNLLDILNIDLSNSPIGYATIKIYKSSVPVVLLLGYYLGLSNLLKTYKVDYKILGKNESYDKVNYYSIPFTDHKLVIKRDYGINDLLFGGLLQLVKTTKNMHLETFEKRDSYSSIFNALELSSLQVNEIKSLEELYIDPVTLEVLKDMKEPTNFKGLLIRSIELLTTDYYKHPNDIYGVHIKGYDRIAGMVYKELMTAMKDQKNKSVFSKSKITINPYTIINKINEDSSTVLMDDINPIAALKQTEDITSLGMGGRAKESMSKDTRILHKSEIGVISEGGKDSGDVGITAYTSANPKLQNTLGRAGELDFSKDGWTSVLSTSAMIAPFGISDDVKRLVFSNIQNSHIIATKNMSIPYVRTGYESLLASRVNDKFATVAIGDGVVRDVTKDKVIVEYKDKTKKEYKLYSWYSKEESGTSFKHTVISNVTKGTKVYKDYVLTYDESFFTPDPYDRSRVVYRQGNVVRVAFVENIESFEDSAAISKDVGKLMTTYSIKSKSKVISNEETIDSLVTIGDKVEPSSPLFIISDKNFNTKGLDEKTLEIIQGIKTSAPKAGIRGVVEDIKLYYNCDLDEVSDDLRYHIEKSDKRLKALTGYTGKVSSGYSIKGKPLLKNEIEIKVLIKVEDDMGIADKAILGNQLKCTIGDILEDMKDEDGNSIDVVFSTKSMSNRIVLSPVKIGLLTTYMKKTIEQACDIYFS